MNNFTNNTALMACLFPGMEVVIGDNGVRVYANKDAAFPLGSVLVRKYGDDGVAVNVVMHEGELGLFANVRSVPMSNVKLAAIRNCKNVPDANVDTEIARLCEHYEVIDTDKALAILSRHLLNERAPEDEKFMTVRAINFFAVGGPTAALWTDDDEETLQLVLQDMQNLAARLVLINKARAAGVAISTIN